MEIAKTSTSSIIFDCPACKTNVVGRLSLDIEVELDEGVDYARISKTTITGVEVSHGCMPKVTR